MYKGSEEEYKLLQNEIEVIRKSILQFIGYIISISGLAAAAANFISKPEEATLLILGSICVGLIIATLLFDVIWYKFKSHNRYVGYTRLLTQELGYFKSKDQLPEKRNVEEECHLDSLILSNCEFEDEVKLYSWEYMMARLNTARFENTKLRILDSVKRIRFKFRLSNGYHYSALSLKHRKNIEDDFFQNIIRVLYTPEKSKYQTLVDSLHDGFWGVIDLYIPIRYSFFKTRFKRIDRRYLSTGWIFPKKVVQVVFLPVLLLMVFFFSVLYQNFSLSLDFSSQNFSMTASILTFLVVLTAFIWVFRYIGGLKSIIYGKYSTEYFSWAFFIYRVQLLNSFNIYPIYFSRNFVRYYKSLNIVEVFSEIQSEVIDVEFKCKICNEKKNRCIKLNVPSEDSTRKFSIQKVQNRTKKLELSYFDEICESCSNVYSNSLINGKRLPVQLHGFHKAIKEYRKIE